MDVNHLEGQEQQDTLNDREMLAIAEHLYGGTEQIDIAAIAGAGAMGLAHADSRRMPICELGMRVPPEQMKWIRRVTGSIYSGGIGNVLRWLGMSDASLSSTIGLPLHLIV